jgi:hypothetical protein
MEKVNLDFAGALKKEIDSINGLKHQRLPLIYSCLWREPFASPPSAWLTAPANRE